MAGHNWNGHNWTFFWFFQFPLVRLLLPVVSCLAFLATFAILLLIALKKPQPFLLLLLLLLLPNFSSPSSPSSSSPSSSSDVEGNRTRFAQTLILHTSVQTMASSCGHNRQFAYRFPSHWGLLPYYLGIVSYLHTTQNSPNRRTQRDKQPSLLKLHLPSLSEAPTLNTPA